MHLYMIQLVVDWLSGVGRNYTCTSPRSPSPCWQLSDNLLVGPWPGLLVLNVGMGDGRGQVGPQSCLSYIIFQKIPVGHISRQYLLARNCNVMYCRVTYSLPAGSAVGTCSVKYKFRCLFLFAGICRGDFSSGLGPMYSYLKRNKIFTSTHLRLCVFEIIDGAKLRNSCYCVP
jgi:hypothetical protein